MRVKVKSLASLVAAIIFLTYSVCSGGMSLPVFDDAQNVEYKSISFKNTSGVIYRVAMNYPAEGVRDFYDHAVSSLGYKAIDTQVEWTTYVDGTIDGRPEVFSQEYNWSNEAENKYATLILKYYVYGKKSRIVLEKLDDLKVTFQIRDNS